MAKRLDKLVADFMREDAHRATQATIERAGTEDRLIMWLVGISAGAIALAVSNLDKVAAESHRTILWSTVFFSASVIFGMAARIVILSAGKLYGRIIHDYQHYLHVEAVYEHPLKELPKYFNAKQIAYEIRDKLDADYTALLEDDHDIAFWRQLYRDTKTQWLQAAMVGGMNIRRKARAFEGKDGEPDFVHEAPEGQELETVAVRSGPESVFVRRARRLRGLGVASDTFFYASVLSFMVGVGVIAIHLVKVAA